MMDFRTLKSKSGQQSLDELRGKLRFDIGKHKSKKLKLALGDLAGKTLLDSNVSKKHASRLEKQFLARWGKLSNEEVQARLRFLTVLHSLSPLDEREILNRISNMKAKLKDCCEKVRGIEVIGAFEIEILNLDKMRHLAQMSDEARKLNTINEMLPAEEKSLFKKGISSYALIHFHGIVDLKDGSEAKAEALTKSSKRWWSEPYAVELKKLYGTFTVRKNLSNIAKYLVKGGNENLTYKIGYGYDTEEAINRHMIKTGKATADADFDGFENEMSLTIEEINILGRSIYGMMTSSGSRNMKNGYLFKHGYWMK